jgi:uncharacterized protein YdhG (YjbR/CyaY superfamily)
MSVIDKYLGEIDPRQRAVLERMRGIIKRIAPEAEEMISYGIPTFKVNNQPLVHLGAYKDHMSLFPTSKPVQVLEDKLKGFKVSRGTIQFTLEKPLPDKLLEEIILIRLADIK